MCTGECQHCVTWLPVSHWPSTGMHPFQGCFSSDPLVSEMLTYSRPERLDMVMGVYRDVSESKRLKSMM